MQQHYDGIKFYSDRDLSCGYYLEKVEAILLSFYWRETSLDINQVIELFNIKQFFKHDIRLKNWTDTEFVKYKGITKELDQIIAITFKKLNDNSFLQQVEEVDVGYIDDFWFLFSHF